ncbi:LysE family translocator [Nocardia aurantiaca]|uniref:LysE family translocator n=1 Tax=Nocardia aurantiaca TaxID=2675850 RepID=A0A6I3KQ68_9NOCA|nr:LysE family translocator [Nocardia aurantiaca]MTE11471.1 LysE family translocator [Nocardia aurantiaca]
MLVALLSFTIASIVLVVLPGPDSLVVMRSLVRGGRSAGARTSAGVLCRLMVWVAAATLGLSALLRASEIGYDVLEIVGACYLIWIGVQSLRSLRHTARVAAEGNGPVGSAAPWDRVGSFAAGFLTDILNPKVGVLFLSLLPGFVPDGYPVGLTTLGLGVLYVALTALYCAGLLAVSGLIATWMRTPGIRGRLDALTGLVLIGFGVRLATDF